MDTSANTVVVAILMPHLRPLQQSSLRRLASTEGNGIADPNNSLDEYAGAHAAPASVAFVRDAREIGVREARRHFVARAGVRRDQQPNVAQAQFGTRHDRSPVDT